MAKNPNIASPLYDLPGAPRKLAGVMWQAMFLGLSLIVVVSWIATQFAAHKLAYQAALGNPLFSAFGIPIYQPFAWVVWGWRYGEMENEYVSHVFGMTYGGVTAGMLVAFFSSVLLAYWRSRTQGGDSSSLHGSAHWASEKEVKATGLVGTGKGVYVGAWEDKKTGEIKYLRHDGPEHIMAFAPTRSGKGVGLILPTLLSWPHSALVYDTKGENYALTAGWRRSEANNHTLKFDPVATDGSSVKFNPLEEIRLRTQKEVSDVQNIVTMIVDPDGKGLNDHWAKTGHALLVGAVLHVLYAEQNKTLEGVAQFLSDPSRTILDTLTYMLQTEHDPDGSRGWPENVHPVVAASARDMLNKSENEMSGVLSTAMSFLTLYRDPVVSRNTAYSEFKIRDLMNAEKPVTLYLIVPPSDKDRLKPLIRLIINQVVRSLTESMKFENGRSVADYKHRLLLMIDEFPSLGKLDIFEESLAFIAGYGMKAYLIIQDISQLWTAYGKDESIFSNCHIRVAYAPNKIETAKLLSDMLGTTTIVREQRSYSGDRLQPMLGNVSSSSQETSRALLTPDEVMRLPAPQKDVTGSIVESGDMLIFSAGHAPIYGKQILYFQDPTFNTRSKIAAPHESDRLIVRQSATQTATGLDEPASIPTPPAQPNEDIAASYAAAENEAAASNESPADFESMDEYIPINEAPPDLDGLAIEDAPLDIEDAPAEIEDAPAEIEDAFVPLDESLAPAESESAASGGGLLPEIAADSLESPNEAEQQELATLDTEAISTQDDLYGLFDDVMQIAQEPVHAQSNPEPKNKAKAAQTSVTAPKPNAQKPVDLYNAAADVLSELAPPTTLDR